MMMDKINRSIKLNSPTGSRVGLCMMKGFDSWYGDVHISCDKEVVVPFRDGDSLEPKGGRGEPASEERKTEIAREGEPIHVFEPG